MQITKYELIQQLEKYNIAYQNWGENQAKPLEKLLEELNTKECSLIEKEGNLIRIVSIAVLDVFYTEANKKYKLF